MDNLKPTLSQGDIARSWSEAVGNSFIWDRTRGCWMVYQEAPGGGLWVQGDELARQSMAEVIELTVDLVAAGNQKEWAKARRSTFKTANVADCLRWARDIPGFYADSADFNRLPDCIGLSNGSVVNLRKGSTRKGTPGDKISWSLQKGIHPAEESRATSPLWKKFLWEALNAYPEDNRVFVYDWLKRFCGYCMTADTKEEAFLFVYGPPGTGKSVFLETIAWIMHEYVVSLSGERLTTNHPQHRQWLARVQGKRLAIVTELPPRGQWNPELTGLVSGEVLEANYMRQNSFEFRPCAKVMVAGNHKPKCDPGSGLWRRMRLIDFSHKPENPDTGLKKALQIQSEGVLQWFIAGAEQFYKRGLQDTPEVIKAATAEYQREQDTSADFFDDCLERTPGAETDFGEIYNVFVSWAQDQGMKPWSKKRLGMELKRHGFMMMRGTGGRKYYGGGRLKRDSTEPIM